MTAADLDRIAGLVVQMLWRSSWQAAVLAVMVLALQFALKRHMSARWRHAMWWVVLLRLLIPVTPASSISVFNVAPARSKNLPMIDLAPRLAATDATAEPMPLAASRTTTAAPIRWQPILAAIWLAGALFMLARIAFATMRLSRAVHRMHPVTDAAVLSMFDRCRDELHVRRRIEVLTSPDIGAPALMGFIRPRLLLPQTVLERFHSGELRLILLHELAHLKRHDVAINWLASILHAVHWFNPIVWLSVLRLRNDRELAADELVLSLTGDDQRGAYGDTLVKLLQTLSRRPAMAGTVGILERAHPMRRRITMIAQFKSPASRWTVVGASACLIVLAGLGLTDAVRGDTPEKAPPAPASTASASIAPASIAPVSATPAAAAATIEERMKERRLKDAADAHLPAPTAAVSSASFASTQPSDAEQTYAKFQNRLPEVRFDAIPLHDVVDFLRDTSGVDIVVNSRALEAAGIDKNVPVDLKLRNATLEQIFRRLLSQAGGGTVALGFGVDGGSIILSTDEDLARSPRIRAYDVSDLITTATTRPGAEGEQAAADELRKLIMDNVAPDSWKDNGGTVANMSVFGGKLIVTTTDMDHLEIDHMLAELRRKH